MPSRKASANAYGPAYSWLAVGAVSVAAAVAGYLSFEFGRMRADFNVIDASTERRDYEDRIEVLEDEVVTLKQEIEVQKTHREVEQAAYQDIEESLGELEAKIQEQRDAIAFYRGIISPADGGKGLRVQDLKLSKGKREGEYNVRLVLVQVKQHDRTVKGEVAFSLEGDQNGEETTYTLEQLLPPDGDSAWPFAFRYFQDFDRQLVLPAGFLPERINIEVRSRTKSIASVKQTFPWQSGKS